MSGKYLLMLLVFVLCSIHAIAQTDYYYHKGNKIPLTLNENKVIVSIPKDCDKTSKKIFANVRVLDTIKDDFFDIYILNRSDFEKLTSLDSWEEDAKSVILTFCYFTERNKEVFATPYLNVRLKEEQDKDLLTSYAEKYKLRIVSNSPLMPLWYILSVTPESRKNPLECANELFESGDFAASVPDLAAADLLAGMAARSITTATTHRSSDIYNLQGRTAQHPSKGIYIRDGRKVVVK